MALITWIFVQDPLERWLDDFRATFDAWHKGGVRPAMANRSLGETCTAS